MIVLVLSACPVGLRGYLTRWLLEVSAGVFVGKVSRRVRERIWERTTQQVKTGRAILVYSARTEQGLGFATHGHHWEPVDVEGISLMLRPNTAEKRTVPTEQVPTGWSDAARRRRLQRGDRRST